MSRRSDHALPTADASNPPWAADNAAPNAIHGRLFEARSAACRPATLLWHQDGSLLLLHDQTRRTLPAGALRWSSRIGTAARRATLPGSAVFETDDNEQVDRLERLYGRRTHVLHRLEHLRMRWLVLATAVALAFLLALRWAIPWLGDTAARAIPPAIETRIGASVLRALDQAVLRPSLLPPERRQAIQAVFDDLLAHTGLTPQRSRLLLRQGGPLVGANAMALPGGGVIVTDELARLVDTPDALAGVLAHEIGHVQNRHGMRRLGRLAGLSAVVLLFSGDASDLLHQAGVLGTGLLDLAYSRDFEHEADASAVSLLRKSGRDPALLATLLRRLSAQSAAAGALPNWLSTHPSTEARTRFILEGH